MPFGSGRYGSNALLGALSDDCQQFLAAKALTKPVVAGELLYEFGEPMQNLVFPHQGVVSLQVVSGDGKFREVLTVGTDGMIGACMFLGRTHSPARAVVATSGSASWLPLHVTREASAQFAELDPVLNSFLGDLIARLMQSVMCASAHSAPKRIASWLIRASDISNANVLEITQQTLGEFLALRQATVSEVCGALGAKRAILQTRGAITITNRQRLEEEACACWKGHASW